VQEEPQNMGAWRAVRHRLEEGLPAEVQLRYCGRAWRASPSEGYPTAHLLEQDRIVSEAHAPAEQRFMASGKEFSSGDAVEIVDGPFRDRLVTVEEIKGPMATIMLELFGEPRAVEVPVKHLEKVA
jgi:hypothetical protein